MAYKLIITFRGGYRPGMAKKSENIQQQGESG